MVRQRARVALHPEQAEMQKSLAATPEDVRGRIGAARRAVLEQCQMDASSKRESLAEAKVTTAA